MRGLTWRVIVVWTTILFSLYLLTPTVIRFTTGKTISKVAKADDPWYFHVLPAEVLKLGLDLVGGLHLVLGIDFNEVQKDAIEKMKNQLKELIATEKIEGVTLETTNDNRILVHYKTDADWKKVDALVAKNLGQYLDFESQTNDTARLHLTTSWDAEVRKRAVEQSLETLRNRIDEFGIAEPIIQAQGEEKIMVQFPGVQDPGRIKEIIARTAKLTFQIVRAGPQEGDGSITEDQMNGWVQEFAKAKNITLSQTNPIPKYLRELNQFLEKRLPAGTEVIFQKKVNINTKEAQYVPYLLEKEVMVSGDELEDAYYAFNEKGDPEVHFQLTPIGAQKFDKATAANVKKNMAIVLDSNVHSAPQIRERIGGGRAKIDMAAQGRSQQEIMNDAKDTALVLRSGALPARLEFLEERVIGPSLGADAIRAGSLSLTIGLLAVFVFMVLYYKASGFIANLALALNGLFVLAIMAAFEGTLTLPGLAGLTLSLGMAIDANVLIFEHMREELRAGKTLASATSEGYHRAFSAILDGHMTTIAAGVVLLSFGYGPIRGFAVTMLIALAASLYTSVFVTRVIFDSLVIARGKKSISL